MINKLRVSGLMLDCKQTFEERMYAVKHQNWDSSPLHKLIKNFPLFARPLHKLIKIPRHSPLIKYQITKLCKISNRKEVDTMISQ
jgi:hypothetical protein